MLVLVHCTIKHNGSKTLNAQKMTFWNDSKVSLFHREKKIIIQMEITIIATRFQNSLQRSITFKKLKQTFSSFIYILNLYFP